VVLEAFHVASHLSPPDASNGKCGFNSFLGKWIELKLSALGAMISWVPLDLGTGVPHSCVLKYVTGNNVGTGFCRLIGLSPTQHLGKKVMHTWKGNNLESISRVLYLRNVHSSCTAYVHIYSAGGDIESGIQLKWSFRAHFQGIPLCPKKFERDKALRVWNLRFKPFVKGTKLREKRHKINPSFHSHFSLLTHTHDSAYF